MTVSASGPSYIHHLADGVQREFPYPFEILSVDQLEVREFDINLQAAFPYTPGHVVTGYTLTGVGTPDGGNIIFFSPPQAGRVIFARRQTHRTQQADYLENDPFTAEGHEEALDKLTLKIHEIYEELSRRPAMLIPILNTLRELIIPAPNPLKLWGWNALGDAITLFDPAIVQVIPATVGDPGALAAGWYQSIRRVTITAAPYAGQNLIPVPNLYPSGALVRGVTMRITTSFGVSGGLTTLALGDTNRADRWGNNIPVAATGNATTNPAFFRTPPFGQLQDWPASLQAESGVFDAVGAAIVTCHYEMFWPDLPSGGVIPTTGGWAQAKNTVTVSAAAYAGQTVIPVPLLYPAGAYIRGVTMRITSGFGDTQGLTGLMLGDAEFGDRWGVNIPLPLGTVTSPPWWNPGHEMGFGVNSATDGFLVAEGGAFDGTGTALVTCHFEAFVPD